jgi:hypothetical protein
MQLLIVTGMLLTFFVGVNHVMDNHVTEIKQENFRRPSVIVTRR